MDWKTLKSSWYTKLSTQYTREELSAMWGLALHHFHGFNAFYEHTHPAWVPDDVALAQWIDLLTQLQSGRPIQYALGVADFMGMQLSIGPGVLIPRPETEDLVMTVTQDLASSPRKIIDLCTGSGCIALALAQHWPDSEVIGGDLSPQALEWARKNGLQYGPDVLWMSLDVIQGTSMPDGKFDLIISNPPYVPHSDQAEMSVHVLDMEPSMALFVPDDRALVYYEAIAEWATQHLSLGGWLYFEIHHQKGELLVDWLKKKGFAQVGCIKDRYLKDRIIRAKWMN
ncbi:MAG: peptide chain release factor N(5)-glutamine methyltransferase [Flavobacteriaceae bacterium]|nr:peptide chain release factor N(5)-glutamine methyltransferase [Flavobacteriaceae bacterium]MDP4886005.1 peptide chain release factor N(5)-glutamine methyltransferase [Flavobacteriaceae bacterium]MDP4971185.1 peptide chain release factor N(5)-glutamine methyltransferase [Flavobacteriaceae bacterium]MDP5113408.1 peptide chain release factor N(5)-glutamine methyltransferase [Flavobacteriaceae bacterium]